MQRGAALDALRIRAALSHSRRVFGLGNARYVCLLRRIKGAFSTPQPG
jgi:hypothetical protein